MAAPVAGRRLFPGNLAILYIQVNARLTRGAGKTGAAGTWRAAGRPVQPGSGCQGQGQDQASKKDATVG